MWGRPLEFAPEAALQALGLFLWGPGMEVVHPLGLQDFWQHQVLAELCVAQLLGLWGHWWCQVCRDMGCLCCRSYGHISVFFWASCSWRSEGLFGQSFCISLPAQTLRGLPCLASFSVAQHVRHIEGPPWVGSYSVVQRVRHLVGQPLYCSASDAGVWGERGCGDGSTPYAWLSSITLLPWLPGFPPQAFPTTVSCLTSPPSVSLKSTAALTLGLLHNPSTPAPSCCIIQPVQVMYGCGMACLILIPFTLPPISCFTLSLKCFSSDADICPDVGIRLLLQFRPPPRAGPALLTLLFFPLVPLSYWVLCGIIYSFPLVKYSCPLSAGILHGLLCLKVFSRCICGERCIACPPAPLPPCSPILPTGWSCSDSHLCNPKAPPSCCWVAWVVPISCALLKILLDGRWPAVLFSVALTVCEAFSAEMGEVPCNLDDLIPIYSFLCMEQAGLGTRLAGLGRGDLGWW